MQRTTTPSFIITLPLLPEPWQKDKLDRDFAVDCKVYNMLRRAGVNRYNQMIKTRRYRYWVKTYSRSKPVSDASKEAKMHLEAMRKEFRLTQYDFEKDVKEYQKYYKKNLHSAVAQKLAGQVWKAFESIIFGKGQLVHHKKNDDFTSIEGKSNVTGIIYRDGHIEYGKTVIKVRVKKSDFYIQQVLKCRVKYCRLRREFVRGEWKYYAQLILEGTPPIKVTETGELKHQLTSGRVGLDIGPQTLAIASEKTVMLVEFADRIQNIENKLRVTNRAMDRSRRATNPSFYNEDGTVIKHKPKEKRKWVYSNRYKKLAAKRRELYRKQAAIRKLQHQQLANFIISLGDEVYIEKMNFAALAKQAKKTEKSDKNGKIKHKKRFGKSIAKKAPAMFVSILEQKLNSTGGHLHKVRTYEMKASQYRHDLKIYKKSKLSERTKEIAGHTIQRDLYSAFLIMNSDPSLSNPDQTLCERTFSSFVNLHDQEIQRLKNTHTLSSMGIKSFKTA